jgi:dual specificity tyrosine-phosphorylation-regulated kinase 2/3/4
LFFDKKNKPKLTPNSRGKVRIPATKKLSSVLKCKDEKFLDFFNKCFVWNPMERMTPLEALQHPWILEGLPEKVLKHHQKMFGNNDNKNLLRDATYTKI